MADRNLDGLFESLGAQFEASAARAEEQAADDLAFSLLQDRRLADVLARSDAAMAHLPSGTTAPVLAIGEDFVIAGRPSWLVPLSRASFTPAPSGPRPRRLELDSISFLRGWARSAATVEVTADCWRGAGKLVSVGLDYLRLECRGGPILVPASAIETVALLSGGSADGW